MTHSKLLAVMLLPVSFSFTFILPATETLSELPTTVVTATRTAQTADDSLASVTVIDRKAIESSQAQSVQDLLRAQPGISISNNGGAGKATSLFLRGTNSDHTLVLIDGVKVGSATLGTTALENIPVEQIDRIEIVRGPRSNLYGSEAIGGVIQIFTKKGGGPTKTNFSVGGGSFQSYNTSIGVSGGGKRAWYNLSASAQGTEGFNSCRGVPGLAGCFTFEPDKDGYRSNGSSLRAGYRFTDSFEAELHALRALGKSDYDGSFQNGTETVQQVIGTKLSYAPTSQWQSTLAINRSQDDSDNFLNKVFSSRFNTTRDNLSWQNNYTINNTIFTFGLDHQDDQVSGTTAYAVTSRKNDGIFMQMQVKYGLHDVQFALRTDDNRQFGDHDTGGVAWGYRLNKTLRVTASYGTAYKAPTFNQLYFPGFGNPNLKAEESQSTEIGLAGTPAWGRWSLNLYRTEVDKLIGFDASFNPVNIDRGLIHGLEAVATTKLAAWNVSTSVSFLDPENKSTGTNNGNVLPRRARQIARVEANRAVGKYRFGALARAEGRRYDDLANTRKLDGYATLDLRGEYLLSKTWRIQARVENVRDKAYETAEYYNQAGRSFFLTLRYQQ